MTNGVSNSDIAPVSDAESAQGRLLKDRGALQLRAEYLIVTLTACLDYVLAVHEHNQDILDAFTKGFDLDQLEIIAWELPKRHPELAGASSIVSLRHFLHTLPGYRQSAIGRQPESLRALHREISKHVMTLFYSLERRANEKAFFKEAFRNARNQIAGES